MDDIPYLVARKVAGRAPPTEVFLKKKSTLSVDQRACELTACMTVEFYKEKQQRNGRSEAKYVEVIKIGLAEGSSHHHLRYPLTDAFRRAWYM